MPKPRKAPTAERAAKIALVSFTVSDSDREIINAIAKRAVACAMEFGGWTYNLTDAEMDVTACHANGNPLKLAALLKADNFNFMHDVFGIRRHLDRDTGKLNDFFSPRFSL